MSARQTRIFVQPTPLFNDTFWVETLVGSVVAPLIKNFPSLKWFWFARYVSDQSDTGDCDINAIPDDFATDSNFVNVGPDGRYRSLRLRYSVKESELDHFEQAAKNLIQKYQCCISDFRDYDFVSELGGQRFLAGEPTAQRQRERAELVLQNFNALSKLYIHTLTGPDQNGHYRNRIE